MILKRKWAGNAVLKMSPRIIDIDILLMDELVYKSSIVIIPHPRLAERRFVLTPLAEIAGEHNASCFQQNN